MDHPRLILHVGGAKCGSSAFQTALSTQSRLTPPEGPDVVYAALHARYGLIHGAKLRALASTKVFGYISSPTPGDLLAMDRSDRTRMLADLRALLANHDHVVLSNEGWLLRHNALANGGVLDALGHPFGVFAAVRPQVEFINSGWWQWGAWKDTGFEDWATRRHPQVLWHSHLRKWEKNPACTEVTVRLLSRDIVGDFLNAYGLTPASGQQQNKASNVSLPGEVLRLFQRHPKLRAGRAIMDFVLSQFRLGDQPTPWVVDPDLARRIIDMSRADNEALCNMLPADQAARMRDTPGWWSADAYAAKPLESPLPQPATPDAATEMQSRLIRAQAPSGALPLPEGASADQLDTCNATRIEALFKAEMALRQNAAP